MRVGRNVKLHLPSFSKTRFPAVLQASPERAELLHAHAGPHLLREPCRMHDHASALEATGMHLDNLNYSAGVANNTHSRRTHSCCWIVIKIWPPVVKSPAGTAEKDACPSSAPTLESCIATIPPILSPC